MDLIIDYMTYVFIPAFALFQSGLLPGWTGWFSTLLITYTSVLYFVDTRMKTKDNSFAGFPGCWNMVILVLFALQPNFYVTVAFVTLLAMMMFTNLKFIHPVRTVRWRPLSLAMTVGWVVFASWAAMVDFHPNSLARAGLVVTSLYLTFAGIAQQLFPPRRSALRD
jgi:phosphatidylcholine synthase